MITDDSTVPVLTISEQHRSVTEIERQLSIVAADQQAITAKLAHAGRLRQSIVFYRPNDMIFG